MSEVPLTKEELLKIATEVIEGKRPESDMQKYGMSFGAYGSGDAAKDKLISELKSLGLWEDDDSAGPDPEAEPIAEPSR